MRTKPAFTLIELLTVAIVIAVLAGFIVMSSETIKLRARDASRRGTVDAYSTALEQWRVTTVGRTYFVSMPGKSCTAANSANTLNDPESTGYGYMAGIGDGCVGYDGGGAGRMSRRNVSSHDGYKGYPTSSIVDALRDQGVLATVRLDPLDEAVDAADIFSVNSSRDFILTLCDSSGFAAASPEEAVNYAIYAQLENDQSITTSSIRECGGESAGKSGSNSVGRGWQTVDIAGSEKTYNYAKGSVRF